MHPDYFETRHAGIGLRSGHYQALLSQKPGIAWIEVHPENYFGGGMHTHLLEQAAALYPLSLHGVGLSLGSSEQVDAGHLDQLKKLVDRFNPVRVSDHASWSASGNAHMNDLLPLPYTEETLAALCRNIDVVQQKLGRKILIENPSTYLSFGTSTMEEPVFLAEAVHRTGCGLLLDINNIIVQAHNHSFDPYAYLNIVPQGIVGEMHLAGHVEQQFEAGTLLVDTHSEPVPDKVWHLFKTAIEKFGSIPTLVEWDRDLPTLETLLAEAMKAENIIKANAMKQEKIHEVA